MLPAERHLTLVEKAIILPCGGLDRIVGGIIGLYDYFPGRWTSTGSTGHLAEKLEGPLSRPEIRQIEADVGEHYSHQADAGYVQPFGNHLSAYQNLCLSPKESRQDSLMGTGTGGRIRIPTERPDIGQQPPEALP